METLRTEKALLRCTDRLEHLCKMMDEIAEIVRYIANRDTKDEKENKEHESQ